MRFLTIGQNLCHGFPASGKTPVNVLFPDIVPTMLYTVFDALQALFRRIKSYIVQP